MAKVPDNQSAGFANVWARLAPWVAIVLALVALFGWRFGMPVLMRIIPGMVAINPMTATSFCLIGLGLVAAKRPGPLAMWVANVLGCVVIAIGLARLGDVAGWWQTHIDVLLFTDKVRNAVPANYMATNTAINLVLTGSALVLRNIAPKSSWNPSQILIGGSCVAASTAVMGYLYGARGLTDFGSFVPMALPTALGFLILGSGQLCAYPDRGALEIWNSSGSVGTVTRRLSAGGAVLCVLLGWATLKGQELGYFRPVLSVAIFAVVSSVSFVALTLWNGHLLRHLEEETARHERELRESEERFRLLADAAFEGIIVSVDGILRDANAQACRLFGYDQEEFAGMPLLNIVAPQMHEMVKSSVAHDDEHHYNSVAVRKDGSQFEVEVVGRNMPMWGERARVSSIRDITAQKNLERMKDEFVSIVSHELRTPLTSIHGSLGLLAGGAAGELPPRAKGMLDIAQRNSKRLLALINDILDMQKIESGNMDFQFVPVDITSLVTTAIEANTAFAEGTNVRLVLEEKAPGVLVKADPDRLMQVLANLISNACKFSPEGEMVALRVFRLNRRVRIEVLDRGEGIPEEFREQVFRKFSQADSSATRQKGGTGLGLNISKAIIERCRGVMGFHSERGVGTVFYFELPII